MVNSGVVEQIAATALVCLQSVPFFPSRISFLSPFHLMPSCHFLQTKESEGSLMDSGFLEAKPSTPLISFHVRIHS